MNKNLIFGALLVLAALLAVSPVSATVTSVSGTIAPSFSFSMAAGDHPGWAMIIGTNDILNGNQIDVTSNTAWTLTAVDLTQDKNTEPPGGAGAGARGRMTFLRTSPNAWLNYLSNPLQLSVNSVYADVPSTTTPGVFHTGTGGTFSGPLKIRQVVTGSDPALTGGIYRIDVTISGQATP